MIARGENSGEKIRSRGRQDCRPESRRLLQLRPARQAGSGPHSRRHRGEDSPGRKGNAARRLCRDSSGRGWLINCHIPEYLPGGPRNHDPLRKRKLLLNRREIERFLVQTQQKGMTVVPLKIYFRDGIAKCELAVAKGKKFHDRRESERQKEAKREADEAMYRSRRR